MKITIKQLKDGKWQPLPLDGIQSAINAMSIIDTPIVAKLEECGDTRYWSNSEEWRQHYRNKGEEIGEMPTFEHLEKLQIVADLFIGSELESLETPPSIILTTIHVR